MLSLERRAVIAGPHDPILITGASGFIGLRVVQTLIDCGFADLRCFVRTSRRGAGLEALQKNLPPEAGLRIIKGNLLSEEDCAEATGGVSVILHLAAGRGEKSVPDAFLNSVVTTRNLLEAARRYASLRRFVNVSSFAVYSNRGKSRGRLLDEDSPVERHPECQSDAYVFAKVKQEEIVREYGQRFGIPHVTIRPGVVYGPGNPGITGRIGIGTFGLFLHLGGPNAIPFTYVENCAEAVVLAGVTAGIEGEVFNVVDDDLPSSRRFLWLYKHKVKRFPSLYVPHVLSYALCNLWECVAAWSDGQVPPAFTRGKWHKYWKHTSYSNAKLKRRLGWAPKVSIAEGMERYFESLREWTPDA